MQKGRWSDGHGQAGPSGTDAAQKSKVISTAFNGKEAGLTGRPVAKTIDETTKSTNIIRIPTVTPILLFTSHQHPQFPRCNRIRLETKRGESNLFERISEGPTYLFRSTKAEEDFTKFVGRGEPGLRV